MFRRLIGEHIALDLVLADDLALVRADAGQLEQVVMNLVVNARDAMEQGGRLTIKTANAQLHASSGLPHQAVLSGWYVMLAVADDGIGMDEKTKRHLFEPFFTTKERGKGTGLGLATVYGIVKQSDGYIWVDSEPGRGSTFTVYLPRTERQTEAASPAAASVARHGGSETVLLVEDEAGVRYLARRMLEHAGYRVLDAASGHDAESIFAGHPGSIDLLITDVVMPGMSGPDLFRRLAVQQPGLKVVYISGYATEAMARQLKLDRGQPHVQKPFTADQLVSYVRSGDRRCSGSRVERTRMMSRPILLVVDDEPIVGAVMKRVAEPVGFEVVVCSSAAEAVATLSRHPADMAFVDLRMPDTNGIDLLRQIRDTVPACEVVLMSGFATIDSAVEAVKLGARDYLTKPLDFDRVTALLEGRARRGRPAPAPAAHREPRRARAGVPRHARAERGDAGGLLADPPPRAARPHRADHRRDRNGQGARRPRAASTGAAAGAPVRHRQLLGGGRDAVRERAVRARARRVHRRHRTQAGPVRGWRTRARCSSTRSASCRCSLQAKLLRVLEDGEVQRVGAVEPRRVDACVFAATNRDLQQDVAAGRFRSDLLFRLNAVEVTLPPLRHRREDIPYLTVGVRRRLRPAAQEAGARRDAGRRADPGQPAVGRQRARAAQHDRACLHAGGRVAPHRPGRHARRLAAGGARGRRPRPRVPCRARSTASSASASSTCCGRSRATSRRRRARWASAGARSTAVSSGTACTRHRRRRRTDRRDARRPIGARSATLSTPADTASLSRRARQGGQMPWLNCASVCSEM